ncbi:programmed cell death protein 6-like [Clytia hemisphaerica]|uniref:EF-hand domain-containing protein n=1 Tax=Clytia hemisphaerica TaxID=252671 RepID=A0A7M6DPW5_9CNID|eukprot:TCONS_00021374-protein
MTHQQYQVDRNYLWNIFQRIDRNGDQSIDCNELQTALKNGSWAPFNLETTRLMIGMFDFNNNGTIDFNEFCSLWQYVTDWTRTFKGYDLDGNGTIDHKELSQAMHGFGFRVSERIISILIRRFDRTGQGQVRFDDFIQLCIIVRMLTNSFQRFDYQRNGNIQVSYEQFLTMVFQTKAATSK